MSKGSDLDANLAKANEIPQAFIGSSRVQSGAHDPGRVCDTVGNQRLP